MLEKLPGFRDFYPADRARRDFLFRRWQQVARTFGFQAYDIPTLESLTLFTEKSGPEIVEQLFNFTDKGEREVALRPELTPSLARMVGSQTNSLKKPVKWFNIAENFRYERPGKGRLRSHYQLNGDIYGEAGPGADAEIVALCLACLRAFGLGPQDIVLRLSDRDLWTLFLAALGHEGDAALGVLSVIDRRERNSREWALKELAPWFGEASDDFLGQVETLTSLRTLDELRQFFAASAPSGELKAKLETRLADWATLLGTLEAYGLGDFIRLDLGIVRGLAYYTGFVFEVFALGEGGTVGRALAGGGRYDHLVKKLGFPDTPAVGFGMGDVTMTDLLDEKGLFPTFVDAPDVFVVAGADELSRVLPLVAQLRELGYTVERPLRLPGFGKQFKLAGQSGARLALIVGAEEAAAGQVKIRDMATGGETLLPKGFLGEAISQILEEGLPKPDKSS